MSKKIMALLSIVENDKGSKLIRELKSHNVNVNFQTVGFGTAPSELMDIFGLGTNDKDVVISLSSESTVRDLIANFGTIFTSHSKYGGLMIVFDISAAGRVLTEILNFNDKSAEEEADTMKNEHHNHLIVISVNEGYTEDVMRVARHAGATGGTVIKGRLADVEQFAELGTADVSGEREMLCILSPMDSAKQIMTAVNAEFGMSSPANGILFAVPVNKAYKI